MLSVLGQVMNIVEASRFLGVSQNSIRKWVREGRLRAHRAKHDRLSFSERELGRFARLRTMPTDVLEITDAAVLLRITREALRQWVVLGAVRPETLPDGRRVFRTEQLERFARERLLEPVTAGSVTDTIARQCGGRRESPRIHGEASLRRLEADASG